MANAATHRCEPHFLEYCLYPNMTQCALHRAICKYRNGACTRKLNKCDRLCLHGGHADVCIPR